MTEQDEQARHDSWIAIGVRTDIPHPARVYNYLLGGKDHFAADREAAEMSLAMMPEVRDSAQGNRLFLARAQITEMFDGRALVDPGVVQISRWHPDGGTPPPNADKVWGYAGVARV